MVEQRGKLRLTAATETSKWWVLGAVGVGTFMAALDGSVVNTILPVINRTFGSTVTTVQWVVEIYLLVVSALLLSFGRLGDLRGHKPVYISGFLVFVTSSAFCGFAPNLNWLIGARALQAIGAAMLYANSPAILTKAFPASERGRALGLQAMMTYLGLVAGPSLGGWLATQFSWRAVFYINLPVGLLALLLSMRFIVRDPGAEHPEPFDWAGAGFFTAGLVALLLGLNQGSTSGWSSPIVLGLLGGAGVLLGIFGVLESRVPNPMLDLNLFRVRLFSAATASAILNYICLYAVIFLLPFYLIQGRGLDPAQAGLILTAQPLVMVVASPLSGNLSDRVGSRVLSTLGMIIVAGGLILLSRLTADSPFWQAFASLAIVGLGVGLFSSPNNSALMGAAPRQRQGIAAGVLATARNVGMALGIGFAGAIYNTVLIREQAQGAHDALFTAIQVSLVAAAAVALLGALTSSIRGGSLPDNGGGRPGSSDLK